MKKKEILKPQLNLFMIYTTYKLEIFYLYSQQISKCTIGVLMFFTSLCIYGTYIHIVHICTSVPFAIYIHIL